MAKNNSPMKEDQGGSKPGSSVPKSQPSPCSSSAAASHLRPLPSSSSSSAPQSTSDLRRPVQVNGGAAAHNKATFLVPYGQESSDESDQEGRALDNGTGKSYPGAKASDGKGGMDGPLFHSSGHKRAKAPRPASPAPRPQAQKRSLSDREDPCEERPVKKHKKSRKKNKDKRRSSERDPSDRNGDSSSFRHKKKKKKRRRHNLEEEPRMECCSGHSLDKRKHCLSSDPDESSPSAKRPTTEDYYQSQ
ncbi:uncharacterized protein LOC143482326 [Brachyhypopomus gauderio]|uniref:uncharacterized protein LOC143482326 n=1 Tax=Brachyhypopomus gauderio TaxID=698409 RepID=UPI004041C758